MLILTRKSGEQIAIGDDIVISLLEIKGTKVKIGIQAPETVSIHRQEIYEKIKKENLNSAGVSESDFSRATSLLNSINPKRNET